MQITARRYDTSQAVTIRIANGRVADVTQAEPDSQLPWIAPGLIDLQVNGYGGQEINDPALDVEKVRAISLAMDALGVARYLPTATTHSHDMLRHSLSTLARATDQVPEVAQRVAGIHLEGPYLSTEDGPRGAHPRQHCRPPDWDEFQRLQEAAGGHIRILTMSPEYDGSEQFIRRVVRSGTLVAIGHTAAAGGQIRAAVDAGARLSTHLGNAAHGQIRRHPNYIWDQLADDRLAASLIVDGHHLPPEVVKVFVRAKTPERCMLVSDITGLAGMPPGRYEETSIGAVEVLADGRLVVAGQRQYLAGASQPLYLSIAKVARFAEIDRRTAVDLASVHPARFLGIDYGRFEPDAPADFFLFDCRDDQDQLTVRATIRGGQYVFQATSLTPFSARRPS